MDNLLLVDDDPVFLQTLERALQRRGLAVSTAQNAKQASQALENESFSLVLLDLNLGTESGLQLLDQLLRNHPQQRVVMLTAYASIATAVDAVKRGADNYLCKPITARDIIKLLEKDLVKEEQLEEAQGNTEPVTETNTLPNSPLSTERLEWEHIQRVLMENDGNISATARALNMHRRTLQRKLQKRPVRR